MLLLVFLLLLFRGAFRFLFFQFALESALGMVFSFLEGVTLFVCLQASVVLVL